MQISRTRLAQILSVQGMHKESTLNRLQEPQADALQMGVERFVCRLAVGSLTSTLQVTRRSKQRETIQLSKAFPGVAVAEITAPALGPAVEIVDHRADGDETPLGAGQLSNLLVGAGHRLYRGKYIEIAMGTTEEVAIVPQRKTQKVQALTRFVKLDDLRFLAIDGELESSFEQSLDPVDQLPGLIARQDHESSGPGEFHPQALSDPDGSLSTHPALMIQSPVVSRSAREPADSDRVAPPDPASVLRWWSDAETVCISAAPI
jgi:hypothetical protein